VKRIVQPELLDALPPADPRAVRSHSDLRRINGWMHSHANMARALKKNWNGSAPRRIIELGAGDGQFLLAVAQKISPGWPNLSTTLLDQQAKVSVKTLEAFAALGWRANVFIKDVFDWPQTDSDIVIANLFLHHFADARLGELLHLISQRASLFIALEPRRSSLQLFCSRCLWAIGCNEVTRHDAVVSVRAGFSGQELSARWPDKQKWRLTEQRAGAFSHLFIAQKNK
jgi:hypothetical protein